MQVYVEAEVCLADGAGAPLPRRSVERAGDVFMEELLSMGVESSIGANLETAVVTLCLYLDAESPIKAFAQVDRIVSDLTAKAGIERVSGGVATARPSESIPA